MNGPEYYAEAERLREEAAQVVEAATTESTYQQAAQEATLVLRDAQVCATLALAAATLATSNRRVTDADDWAEAMGS